MLFIFFWTSPPYASLRRWRFLRSLVMQPLFSKGGSNTHYPSQVVLLWEYLWWKTMFAIHLPPKEVGDELVMLDKNLYMNLSNLRFT